MSQIHYFYQLLERTKNVPINNVDFMSCDKYIQSVKQKNRDSGKMQNPNKVFIIKIGIYVQLEM